MNVACMRMSGLTGDLRRDRRCPPPERKGDETDEREQVEDAWPAGDVVDQERRERDQQHAEHVQSVQDDVRAGALDAKQDGRTERM